MPLFTLFVGLIRILYLPCRPQQFRTWWKNNIERQSRLEASKKETERYGDSSFKHKKVNFRKMSVLLAESIRNHFARQVKKNFGAVIAYDLPEELRLNAYTSTRKTENAVDPVEMKKSRIFGRLTVCRGLDDAEDGIEGVEGASVQRAFTFPATPHDSTSSVKNFDALFGGAGFSCYLLCTRQHEITLFRAFPQARTHRSQCHRRRWREQPR